MGRPGTPIHAVSRSTGSHGRPPTSSSGATGTVPPTIASNRDTVPDTSASTGSERSR